MTPDVCAGEQATSIIARANFFMTPIYEGSSGSSTPDRKLANELDHAKQQHGDP